MLCLIGIRLIAVTVFDSLRIWGITQHRWTPAAFVFILSIFDPAVNIVSAFTSPNRNDKAYHTATV